MVNLTPNWQTRDRVLALIAQKERIENDLRQQRAILETNTIGLSEPLVDNEGYPRSDIDVYQVRHARNRIICLQNDHTEIMKRIEQGLVEYHATEVSPIPIEGLRIDSNSTNGNSTNGHSNGHVNGQIPMDCGESNETNETFALIGRVQHGSPADLSGLEEGDQLLQFGTLTCQNFNNVSQIQNIVTHSVGQMIQVKVKRLQNVINLNVTPNYWAQVGLLGCRIDAL